MSRCYITDTKKMKKIFLFLLGVAIATLIVECLCWHFTGLCFFNNWNSSVIEDGLRYSRYTMPWIVRGIAIAELALCVMLLRKTNSLPIKHFLFGMGVTLVFFGLCDATSLLFEPIAA